MAKNNQSNDREQLVGLLLMLNSNYWFVRFAAIIPEGDKFRLFVAHNKHTLIDELYNNIWGAKVAFTKSFKKKAWKNGLKPTWSTNFEPEQDWLKEQGVILHKEQADKYLED